MSKSTSEQTTSSSICTSSSALMEGRIARQTIFRIDDMDCASEKNLIQNGLLPVKGIVSLDFDLPKRLLYVTHSLSSTVPILAVLSVIGMHAREVERNEATEQAKLKIANMDCPSEEKLIREKLQGMTGIHELDFDLANRTLTITHVPGMLDLAKQALTDIGFSPQPPDARAACSTELAEAPEVSEAEPTSGTCSATPVVATSCGCSTADVPLLTATTKTSIQTAAGQQTLFRIQNMDCPTEEALIRSSLQKVSGIQALDFNLVQRTLWVTHSLPSTVPIMKALSNVGMRAQEVVPHSGTTRTALIISKMDCPTEEALIRKRLGTIVGIEDMEFNLMQRTLTLTHALDALNPVLAALKEIGLEAQTKMSEVASEETAQSPVHKYSWIPMAFSGAAALSAEVVHWMNGGTNNWLVIALALAAIFTGGLGTYKKGWIALKNRNLNMNALMSIAVTGAMIIGQWPEAAMVMFLFALAELIEQKSLDRARNAIRGLMDMAPETATVREADGSWQQRDAKSIGIGAVVRVRPGERIALDGKIINGQSTINQAPITGESVPLEKSIGDPVFAGTINEAGSFEFAVTALASNTTLARIIHAVEQAQGSRAPTQRFVDQFAKVYTPAVFIVALLIAIVPPLVFAQPWYDWIYKALVLLVVACPCALVISTPVTIVSGLAAAARKGILVKGGVYLEQGHKLTWLALDKTGTLTLGKPSVTEYQPLNDNPSATLAIAASLAGRSDHPVSHAVAVYADSQKVEHQEVERFNALLGRGVEGVINGQTYWLGNHRLATERGQITPQLTQQLETLERQGRTAVMLGTSNAVLAIFGVADTVRETSRQAIAELHALNVKTIMLTGDNAHTARAIAAQVGIDDARGNQLPEDKLRVVELLSAQSGTIGMVGDGINDAPALAKADIGFAMGAAGTDTAIETADVALMDDDLRKVPAFVRLSRTTAQILTQNIVLALGIKVIFVILTFTGHATMWMAVFADMGASLLVVFNGLRLLRK
ncbi:heavy metal translocating P-type ATPase [Herminiimonas aquatilis]|uniref:P-type Zn(2+) transporter n=1 Tax=Herminiimonas aquatilis TaxID=345342 RepID=A0ABW2J6J8_9BURK